MLQHGLGKERSVACGDGEMRACCNMAWVKRGCVTYGDGEMRACYNMAWAKRGVLHVGMGK